MRYTTSRTFFQPFERDGVEREVELEWINSKLRGMQRVKLGESQNRGLSAIIRVAVGRFF